MKRLKKGGGIEFSRANRIRSLTLAYQSHPQIALKIQFPDGDREDNCVVTEKRTGGGRGNERKADKETGAEAGRGMRKGKVWRRRRRPGQKVEEAGRIAVSRDDTMNAAAPSPRPPPRRTDRGRGRNIKC